MALTNSELLDKIDSALENALLGKDVMFDGHRVTLDNVDRLYTLRGKVLRKINAAAGNGMMKNNVGILKRD
jgi:hypothetical protein